MQSDGHQGLRGPHHRRDRPRGQWSRHQRTEPLAAFRHTSYRLLGHQQGPERQESLQDFFKGSTKRQHASAGDH